MKNFDLRNFLTENKLTTNSHINEVTVKAGDRVRSSGIEVELVKKTEDGNAIVNDNGDEIKVNIKSLKTLSGEQITSLDAPLQVKSTSNEPQASSSPKPKEKYDTADQVTELMREYLRNTLDNLREGIFMDRTNLLDAVLGVEDVDIDEDAFEQAYEAFNFEEEVKNAV